LELLPPTITDPDGLARVGEILRLRPTAAETSALRARLFGANTWQQLVDFASAHGILMPCISALRERALLLPLPQAAQLGKGESAHVTRALEDIYARHLERRRALRGELAEVVTALNRRGIAPLLIKGARYLVADCPSWSEARDMRDLDIVVPRERGAEAVAALEAEGYVAQAGGPTDHHLPELRHPDRSFSVELHIEALGYVSRRLLATDLLWAVSRPGTLEDLDLRILPPAWHLLHALLHHQVSDRGYARRLLAIKDVWEFSRTADALAPEEWHAVGRHMQSAGAADVLGSFIAQAERLFGLAAPAGVGLSAPARAHAEATLRRAQAPHWLRCLLFTADKLRFAFAPATLAVRYPKATGNPLGVTARHIGFLLRLHGGVTWRRMSGRDGTP
jgi:Uncharacterised nucleotidyltransferase